VKKPKSLSLVSSSFEPNNNSASPIIRFVARITAAHGRLKAPAHNAHAPGVCINEVDLKSSELVARAHRFLLKMRQYGMLFLLSV
jgi:hypothetical protein